MKVFLVQNIKNLGNRGEVKEVNDGYARNFLIPRELAILPSDPRAQGIKQEKQQSQEEEREAKKELSEKLGKLNGRNFLFKVKADKNGHLYGSIGPKELSQKTGLPENLFKEHIKVIGSFPIEVKVTPDNIVKITIVVQKEE